MGPLRWWTTGPAPVQLRRAGSERGAPVYRTGRETGEYVAVEIRTGETTVAVSADTERQLRNALDAVGRLDDDRGPLAPPTRPCG